jgi:hypothetical protein
LIREILNNNKKPFEIIAAEIPSEILEVTPTNVSFKATDLVSGERYIRSVCPFPNCP